MAHHKTVTIATYGILSLAGVGSVILPNDLGIDHASAASLPDVIRVPGVVRDFRSIHTDFDAKLSEANGHVAGLVGSTINQYGQPEYDGSGNLVLNQATDVSGNNIAPVLAYQNLGVNFTIGGGKVTVGEAAAAKLTVLGSAMENTMAQMRVTVRLRLGTTTSDPFGSFTSATAGGNVHDSNNPRNYIMPNTVAANTAISVIGRSWGLVSGTWHQFWNVDSANGATGPGSSGPNVGSGMVRVLRNGDSVPTIAPFGNQATIENYVKNYINVATQKVTIADNQAIFLFELATNDPTSEYYDFQDLVVLLTMAKSSAALATPQSAPTACSPGNDTVAKLDAATNAGAITSADTFKQWFSSVPGTNLSNRASMDFRRQNDNSYLFDDSQDPYYKQLGGFYPADNQMFNDEGGSGHNESFTYSFEARFVYDKSIAQFFEVLSDMEVWVFIDDQLVIDLGGFHSSLEQRIDLSRLCLEDGKEYKLSLFLASRYAQQAALRLHTNLQFLVSDMPVDVAAAHD